MDTMTLATTMQQLAILCGRVLIPDHYIDPATDKVNAERAHKGAALLDDTHANWFHEVNPKTLNIRSMSRCVLAQIYGDYAFGYRMLFGNPLTRRGIEFAFGFDCSDANQSALETAWVDEIAWRRIAKSKPQDAPIQDKIGWDADYVLHQGA